MGFGLEDTPKVLQGAARKADAGTADFTSWNLKLNRGRLFNATLPPPALTHTT